MAISIPVDVKSEKASPSKSKAAGGEAEKPAKAKKTGDYAPPSRDAWRDMKNQLISLQKAKKASGLVEAWRGKKTQSEKRQFYYEMFLLDPNVSKKEVHKQSWQKQTSLQRQIHGWMTKWEIGKLEGADSTLKNFEELCDAACKGLPERKHELPAWAAQGIMQYECSKKLHKEATTEDGQTVKAAQSNKWRRLSGLSPP